MKLGQLRRQDQCQQICSTFIVEGTGLSGWAIERKGGWHGWTRWGMWAEVSIFFHTLCHINQRGVFSTSQDSSSAPTLWQKRYYSPSTLLDVCGSGNALYREAFCPVEMPVEMPFKKKWTHGQYDNMASQFWCIQAENFLNQTLTSDQKTHIKGTWTSSIS